MSKKRNLIGNRKAVLESNSKAGGIEKKPIFNQPCVLLPYFLLLVLPIYWSFSFSLFSLQDLPNHLANAHIFVNYHSSAFFREYFTLNLYPYPYLLQDLILGGLIVVAGPDFAGRLFVAVVMVSMPLGVFYLVKTCNPTKPYLCYFSLPFVWNVLWWQGNLNYLMGLAIALVCLAMLWQNLFNGRPVSGGGWSVFGLGLLMMYLAHIVAFVLFIFMALMSLLVKFKAGDKRMVLMLPGSAGLIFLIYGFLFAKQESSEAILFSSIFERVSDVYSCFKCFSPLDFHLVPVAVLMLLLIGMGFVEIRKEPLPFILCGLLIVIFLVLPKQWGDLVRPQDRVLFMLIFMAPICCVGRYHIPFERTTVIIVCTIVFLSGFNYFSQEGGKRNSYFSDARNLLRRIPGEKKLMPVWPYGTYCGHVDAFYVIDGDGYVPTLFSAPYMMVRYREKPFYSPMVTEMTPDMLRRYDYLLMWGVSKAIDDSLAKHSFTPILKSGVYGIYKNALPSL